MPAAWHYFAGIIGFVCVALACLGRIWCSLFIAGHYYKIVPFLIWYHRFGPLIGIRKVPKVAELFSQRAALIDGLLLVTGYAGIAVAIFLRSAALARAFAVVFAAGALFEVIMIARISRRRPT